MNLKTLMLIGCLLSTLLSGLLSGCTTGVPGVIEQPKISVEDASLQDLSLMQGTALVALKITNPNPFPLPITGIEYGLRLNGVPVAGGAKNDIPMIAAQSTIPVQIPLQLRLMDIAQLIPQMWQQRQVQYDLSGAVKLPLISIPFQRQGGYGVSR